MADQASSLLSLLERGLTFTDEDRVMERLACLEQGGSLVGFSSRGMIELHRVSGFAYTVEFYDFSSRISHAMGRPLKLAGVPRALRVILEEAKGGRIDEYKFVVFGRLASNEGSGALCLR